MDILFDMITEEGSREVNEDFVSNKNIDNSYMFALADGLGGHGKGEIASKLVVNKSIQIYEKNQDVGVELLKKAFEESQEALLAKQERENQVEGMKTTLVLAEIENEELFYGHIGDSRLYIFRGNEIVAQTKDHSVPQMMVLMGDIEEKDIRNHVDRNRLLKVLGVDWEDGIKYELCKEAIQLQNGDAILLATDGFWELIKENNMIKLLKKSKSPSIWLKKMEKIVMKNGRKKNMDNYSAIAIYIS